MSETSTTPGPAAEDDAAGPEGTEPAAGGEPATWRRRAADRLRRGWLAWRRWRRTRPFWGGLLAMLGGGWTLATVKAPLPVILHVGLQGTASYVVPLIVVLCGLLLWVNPGQRLFYSLFVLVFTLLSWITSNLGGFFLGILLGLLGGSLAFAWVPARAPRVRRRRGRPA